MELFLPGNVNKPSSFFTPRHWVINDGVIRALDDPKTGVVIIVGEEGVGKTTLLRELIKSYRNEDNYIISLREHDLSFDGLISFLDKALVAVKLEEEPASSAYSLKNKLLKLDQSRQKCILVIDDAQNLSKDLLGALHRMLRVGEHNGIQLLICGNQELEEKLEAQSKLMKFCQDTFRMEPMSVVEVKTFSQQYLATILTNPKAAIEVDLSLALYWYSKGNLKVLSQMCRHILLLASQKTILCFDRDVVEQVAQDMSLETPNEPFPEDVQVDEGPKEDFFSLPVQSVPSEDAPRARPKDNDPSLKLADEESLQDKPKIEKRKRRKVRARTVTEFRKLARVSAICVCLVGIMIGSIAMLSGGESDSSQGKVYQQAYEAQQIRSIMSREATPGFVDQSFLSLYSGLRNLSQKVASSSKMPSFISGFAADTYSAFDQKKFEVQVKVMHSLLDGLSEKGKEEVRRKKAQRAIATAQELMGMEQYVFPLHANAYMFFRRALMWDSDNPVARQGVEKINGILKQLAQEAQDQRDWGLANKYFDITLRINALREIE